MTNLPISGIFRITAYFKQKNSKLWKTLGFHTGIDFVGNDNIYATCDSIVDTIAYSSTLGNYIIIKENKAERYHYFCHLKSIKVTKNKVVTRTTIIGIMGSTGNVSGKHLHYEIRKKKGNLTENNLINPAEYCKIPNKRGVFNSEDYKLPEKAMIKYEAHIQNIGWQESKQNGEILGTVGKALRIEAINIHSNIPLQYRVHIQNKGWSDWVPQDCIAGTVGKSLQLEAIHIIAQKQIKAVAHVQNIGWQEEKIGTEIIIGTERKSLRLEALKLEFI